MNKKTFGYIILLGSAWGLAECGLGAGLKACASSISGSVMTAVALFFIAAAWIVGRKAANVALLVAVAIGFKMFDALLIGVPLRSGAITHPVFAFVLEGAGFLVVGVLLMRSRKPSSSRGEAKALRSRPEPGIYGVLHPRHRTLSTGLGNGDAQSPSSELGSDGTISPREMTSSPGHMVSSTRLAQMLKSSPARGILWGGASALLAAAAFPLVKFASGIPACVVPGSTIPMVWAYAPLAVGLSMLTVPLGFKTAEKARAFISGPVWRIPAAILLSLALWGVRS